MNLSLPARSQAPEPPLPSRSHTSSALACLLAYAPQAYVALPVHAGVELVEQPRVVTVPRMPHFCRGLAAWQGRQLPLIDLHAYLQGPNTEVSLPFSHVLVVAYQAARHQAIEYGALCAPFLLRIQEVADSQQCPLPDEPPDWAGIAVSCFLYQGRAVPVLDLASIFTRPATAGITSRR